MHLLAGNCLELVWCVNKPGTDLVSNLDNLDEVAEAKPKAHLYLGGGTIDIGNDEILEFPRIASCEHTVAYKATRFFDESRWDGRLLMAHVRQDRPPGSWCSAALISMANKEAVLR